jgi:hypothetical protein
VALQSSSDAVTSEASNQQRKHAASQTMPIDESSHSHDYLHIFYYAVLAHARRLVLNFPLVSLAFGIQDSNETRFHQRLARD